LQPFKIPTGSIAATLNGIIGYCEHSSSAEHSAPDWRVHRPGSQLHQRCFREDDQLLEIQPKKMFFFFYAFAAICQRQKYLVYAPPDTLSLISMFFPAHLSSW